MKAVRFFGPIGDSSGYGNAVRNFAEAFALSGIPTQFHFPKSKLKYVEHLENYQGKTNIDFYLHCPPYNRHKTSNFKIGYFYWEADKLPLSWSKSLNYLDELWVPCQLVKNACLSAGFKKTIKIVPTPFRLFNLSEKISIPSPFSNDLIIADDVFKFYSIFQWHERKGYKELLKGYLSEFTPNDKVLLILKVNPLNIGIYTEEKISNDIFRIKSFLNQKDYPPIYLSKKILPESDIYALHNSADCYVAAHHGEGWGMPIHDAMYAKRQIIATPFGGVTEYLDSNSAHLINYNLKPVSGMEWSPLYGPYQKWAHPDISHLSQLMRDVYENHSNYHDKAAKAHQVADSMSIRAVAKIIAKELSVI